MAEPFVCEIRMFPWSYAPANWALCAGTILSINQNGTLWTLLGAAFGGDGMNTFALPDLRGRTIVGEGFSSGGVQNYRRGDKAGVETVALAAKHFPSHTHQPWASSDPGTWIRPGEGLYAIVNSFGGRDSQPIYASPDNLTPLDPSTVAPAGAGEPRENMQPFAVVNFCIALEGDYPPRR